MKNLAEQYLGPAYRVTTAVISVPAYFNDIQIQAAKNASDIAGLKVLSLIKEPTAVALAYRHNKRHFRDETNLIIDVGAGGISTALAHFKEDGFTISRICGTNKISGNWLDKELINILKTRNDKISKCLENNPKAYQIIKIACNKLKENLTLLRKSETTAYNLATNFDAELSITREEFEECVSKMLKENLSNLIDELLGNDPSSDSSVDNVILAGGYVRVSFIIMHSKQDF